MKNKFIFIISLILIITSATLFLKEKLAYNNDIKKQNNLIEKHFNKYDKYNISEEYLGYIKIDKYNIKRLIKYGTDKKILDENYVGMMHISDRLDSKYGNIILAGHNINVVFKKLHKININDEIDIITNKKNYKFKVFNKVVISKDDYSYFKRPNDKLILTLITCTQNNTKRLIIQALQE